MLKRLPRHIEIAALKGKPTKMPQSKCLLACIAALDSQITCPGILLFCLIILLLAFENQANMNKCLGHAASVCYGVAPIEGLMQVAQRSIVITISSIERLIILSLPEQIECVRKLRRYGYFGRARSSMLSVVW